METPSIVKVRAAAKRHGLGVRTSSMGRHWLVETSTGRLRSPQRGVTLDEVWRLIALPVSDPRAEEMWTGAAH